MLTKLKWCHLLPELPILLMENISGRLQDLVGSQAFWQTEEFMEEEIWFLVGRLIYRQVWRAVHTAINEEA